MGNFTSMCRTRPPGSMNVKSGMVPARGGAGAGGAPRPAGGAAGTPPAGAPPPPTATPAARPTTRATTSRAASMAHKVRAPYDNYGDPELTFRTCGDSSRVPAEITAGTELGQLR